MFKAKPMVIVLVGATASGKTETAINLAKITNSEIINADSKQIYKELCIGTAKPKMLPTSVEMQLIASLQNKIIDEIAHYGFDLCSIGDNFDVAKFLKYFNETAKLILSKGKNIILTGGTGFYIDACMHGLANIPDISPDIKTKVADIISINGLDFAVKLLRENDKITKLDEKNSRRVARALEVYFATNIPLGEWHLKTLKNDDYNFAVFGLKLDRENLYQRINQRALKMIDDGMIDEAKFLKNLNLTEAEIKKTGIGYNHLIKFLDDKMTLEQAIELMQQETRNYAKRQMTWFNRYKNVQWIDSDEKSNQKIADEIKFKQSD